jgi:succinate dehydrogenase/fumarate reductase flavoprotein subunit
VEAASNAQIKSKDKPLLEMSSKRRWAVTVGVMTGMFIAALEATVLRWNHLCETGKDVDFGRRKMLLRFGSPPYYAIELSPAMLNTQGGPRRNERGQILRPDGTPIPRLYSAGELGSIYSYLYQGTGNIGECLAFGRISARNAVAESPWDGAAAVSAARSLRPQAADRD